MLDEDNEKSSGVLIKAGGIAAGLLCVIALAVKGYLLAMVAWSLGSFLDLARFASVGSWPAQRGFVQEWGVRYRGDGAFVSWADYLYEVDGEVYRGWRSAISPSEYRSEEAAKAALTKFPIGEELHVRVNPFSSTDAVLDPDGRDWMTLGLRLLIGCLLLALVGALLASLEVPLYAVTLAVLGAIALGGLCAGISTGPSAERAGISLAEMWKRQARLSERRAAWSKLRPGTLVSSAPAIGKPDKVVESPGGPQTWIYDARGGLETSGKLMVNPSTKGWVVDRAFPPFVTK